MLWEEREKRENQPSFAQRDKTKNVISFRTTIIHAEINTGEYGNRKKNGNYDG